MRMNELMCSVSSSARKAKFTYLINNPEAGRLGGSLAMLCAVSTEDS